MPAESVQSHTDGTGPSLAIQTRPGDPDASRGPVGAGPLEKVYVWVRACGSSVRAVRGDALLALFLACRDLFRSVKEYFLLFTLNKGSRYYSILLDAN